jgi:hypothetical protein
MNAPPSVQECNEQTDLRSPADHGDLLKEQRHLGERLVRSTNRTFAVAGTWLRPNPAAGLAILSRGI